MSYNVGASSSQSKPLRQMAQDSQLPTPPKTPGSKKALTGGQDQVYEQERRYTLYPEFIDPQQPQPAPYQSNGRRRRRTQVELLMYHAIAWLGYGAVVPNVSVRTGAPLVDGPIPTHGTRRTGCQDENAYGDDGLVERVSDALTIEVNRNARNAAGNGYGDDDYDDDELAERVSRALTIGVNKNAGGPEPIKK